MKKSIAIVVLVAMLMGVFCTVALARYTYISRAIAYLDVSGGTASVKGTVETFDPGTIKIKMVLERKPISGSTWSEYTSWSDSKANSTRYTATGSTSVPSGYYYRVKVTGTVSGENAIATSGECKYQ